MLHEYTLHIAALVVLVTVGLAVYASLVVGRDDRELMNEWRQDQKY